MGNKELMKAGHPVSCSTVSQSVMCTGVLSAGVILLSFFHILLWLFHASNLDFLVAQNH